MTHTSSSENCATGGEAIVATLLDALCSPQLYDITIRDGEVHIRPHPHMHSQRLSAAAE